MSMFFNIADAPVIYYKIPGFEAGTLQIRFERMTYRLGGGRSIP